MSDIQQMDVIRTLKCYAKGLDITELYEKCSEFEAMHQLSRVVHTLKNQLTIVLIGDRYTLLENEEETRLYVEANPVIVKPESVRTETIRPPEPVSTAIPVVESVQKVFAKVSMPKPDILGKPGTLQRGGITGTVAMAMFNHGLAPVTLDEIYPLCNGVARIDVQRVLSQLGSGTGKYPHYFAKQKDSDMTRYYWNGNYSYPFATRMPRDVDATASSKTQTVEQNAITRLQDEKTKLDNELLAVKKALAIQKVTETRLIRLEAEMDDWKSRALRAESVLASMPMDEFDWPKDAIGAVNHLVTLCTGRTTDAEIKHCADLIHAEFKPTDEKDWLTNAETAMDKLSNMAFSKSTVEDIHKRIALITSKLDLFKNLLADMDSKDGDCIDRNQCWEPCGALGKSAEHAKPASVELQPIRKSSGNQPDEELAACTCGPMEYLSCSKNCGYPARLALIEAEFTKPVETQNVIDSKVVITPAVMSVSKVSKHEWKANLCTDGTLTIVNAGKAFLLNKDRTMLLRKLFTGT